MKFVKDKKKFRVKTELLIKVRYAYESVLPSSQPIITYLKVYLPGQVLN